MISEYKGNKGFRLLSIYEKLNKGELLEKVKLADFFGVSGKTIQRDIDDLRTYLAETHIEENETCIKFSKGKNAYYLVRYEREWLTNEDVMALCKILLESRAFCKEELNSLICKLLLQIVPADRKKIENIILNEQHHYIPLCHGRPLLPTIWILSNYINSSEIVKFMYKRQDGISNLRTVKPVSIMFSEYYFYLIAYMGDGSKDFPTVFRIDRISSLEGTKERFKIPYRERFNDGEFRKRVQFMYSGELKRVTFEYSGPSLEAVLDRLPTAEVIKENNGIYTMRAEAYGDGIDMWLASLGNYIRVLGGWI